MEINKVTGYLDGGSIEIVTKDEIYFIDGRIGTKTRGLVFIGYPKNGLSNLVSDQINIKVKIIKSINETTNLIPKFNYKDSIIKLLEND